MIKYSLYLFCVVWEIFALYLMQQHRNCSSFRGSSRNTSLTGIAQSTKHSHLSTTQMFLNRTMAETEIFQSPVSLGRYRN